MSWTWRTRGEGVQESAYKRWSLFQDFVRRFLPSNEAKYTSVMSKDEVELATQLEAEFTLPGELSHLSLEDYAAAERMFVRKIDLRLMPILCTIIVLK